MNFTIYAPLKMHQEKDYNYIKKHITQPRTDHLFELANITQGRLKISLRDIRTNYWTKWESYFKYQGNRLEIAYDVHRSLLPNEILIESDYPSYIENVEASRFIGQMIEPKGFIPHYYYSGSKSIHIHILLDFEAFSKLSDKFYDDITKYFVDSESFFEQFIIWIRALMVSNWGFNIVQFDEELIRSSHLIRSELSLNKKGFKTFLGYSYKDLPDTPTICNAASGTIPRIATKSTPMNEYQFELKECVPTHLEETVAEFLAYYDKVYRLNKNRRKMAFLEPYNHKPKVIRPEVKKILNDNFRTTDDGMKRALFILCNEVKQVYTKSESTKILLDWNVRMGNPFKDYEIIYRVKKPSKYILRTSYIISFLSEIGIPYP